MPTHNRDDTPQHPIYEYGRNDRTYNPAYDMKALAEEGPRSYNPPDGLVTLKDQQHEQRGLIGGMLTRANAEAAIAN